MENQYGISVRNKYDLFLSNEDPLEILKLQEESKAAARKGEKTKKGSAGTEKDTKSTKNKQNKALVPSVPAGTQSAGPQTLSDPKPDNLSPNKSEG